MPVHPDSLSARQATRASLHAQFWQQESSSPASLSGLVWALPCEPPPPPQRAPSGLLRSQQLRAAQALGVAAVPLYDQGCGGLALDRALAQVGRGRWWAALSTRIKAQRMYDRARWGSGRLEEAGASPLGDPDNFGLCAEVRGRLPHGASANLVVESPSAAGAVSVARELIGAVERARSGTGTWRKKAASDGRVPWAFLDGQTSIRGRLRCPLPGHELVLGGRAEPGPVSGGLTGGDLPPSGRSPASSYEWAADVQSRERRDGIHYRLGLHQYSSPEDAPTAHFQGAVALEGESTLWSPRSVPGLTLEERVEEDEELDGKERDGGRGREGQVRDEREKHAPGEPTLSRPRDLAPIPEALQLAHQLVAAGRWVLGGAAGRSAPRSRSSRRLPYSFFAARPQLKLHGSIGCLARAQLPPVQLPGAEARAEGRTEAQASSASSLPRLNLQREPYSPSQIVGLHVFGSLALVGQLGRFHRRFMDYTRGCLRVDVGLTRLPARQSGRGLPPPGLLFHGAPPPMRTPALLPSFQPSPPRPLSPLSHPAPSVWHALTLSASQQIWGRLRAGLDLRWGLHPQHRSSDEGEGLTLLGLARSAQSVRPCLTEAVAGLDWVVPGSGGVARVVAWYSFPNRLGMLELRAL